MPEQKKGGFFSDLFAPVGGFGVTFATMFRKVETEEYPEEKRPTQPRFHGELVDRVQRQELQARGGVQLLCAKAFEVVSRTRGPLVAVVHGVAQQRARRVEEPVVDGPRVDADPVDRPGRQQPVEHSLVQRENVPVQGARGPHGTVGEPVTFP